MTEKLKKLLAMGLWFFVSLLLLSACGEKPGEEAEVNKTEEQTGMASVQSMVQVPAQVQTRILTALASEQLVPQTVTAPGEVTLDLTRVAKISSRIEGLVERVFVQLGDRVRRDQPLVAIGSLKLDELVQEFLVAKVQADVTKTHFLRTKKLLAEQVVSQRRYLEDRAKFLKAKAVHEHVLEKLRNMGLTNSDLEELLQGKHLDGHHYLLKAPLSGVIASQTVVLGEGIIPGDELMEIVDTSRVWVFANLPVELVGQFNTGDRGVIIPKGREPIEAVLDYISPLADKKTLSVRLRFDVENSQGVLKPNEYVEVNLMDEPTVALTIPRSALTLIDGVPGVFVQQQYGYVFVPTTVGKEGDDWVEVLQGVSAGQHVVTKGVFDLKNAMLKESIQGE